jgi:hypothetical protein
LRSDPQLEFEVKHLLQVESGLLLLVKARLLLEAEARTYCKFTSDSWGKSKPDPFERLRLRFRPGRDLSPDRGWDQTTAGSWNMAALAGGWNMAALAGGWNMAALAGGWNMAALAGGFGHPENRPYWGDVPSECWTI